MLARLIEQAPALRGRPVLLARLIVGLWHTAARDATLTTVVGGRHLSDMQRCASAARHRMASYRAQPSHGVTLSALRAIEWLVTRSAVARRVVVAASHVGRALFGRLNDERSRHAIG